MQVANYSLVRPPIGAAQFRRWSASYAEAPQSPSPKETPNRCLSVHSSTLGINLTMNTRSSPKLRVTCMHRRYFGSRKCMGKKLSMPLFILEKAISTQRRKVRKERQTLNAKMKITNLVRIVSRYFPLRSFACFASLRLIAVFRFIRLFGFLGVQLWASKYLNPYPESC